MSVIASSIVANGLITEVSTKGVEESQAKLVAMGKTSDEVGKKLDEGLKFAALGGGAALLGVGIAATHMAGDFEAGMTTLVTGAGELRKNLEGDSAGILKLATDTGTTTQQLTAGAFMISSAGQKGAQMLTTLRDAAEGAKVGVADLGTVADATTTIMTDFARQHVTSAQAVNLLVATVASGKTHMQDLAQSLAMILPTAAAYKVHLYDIAAAMATMTAAGVPAADAATYLRQTIVGLGSGSPGAIKALKEIGLSADQVNTEMKKSLPATLQMIEDHLKKKFPEGSTAFNEALKAIAGGSKQMQGMLDLTGEHLATFKNNVASITDAVQKGGKSITGWSDVQKDFNFKMEQAHAALDVFLIQLGTSLLPLVSELIAYFTSQLLPRLSDFSTWFAAQGVPALQNFGSTLGPIVTDLIGFAQWLAQGSPPAHALTTAALALAGAIALVKIANIVSDMAGFIAAAPQMVMKLLFVQGAATGTAGSVASIGVAAETSAGEVALSSVAEEGSLAKVALAGDAAATGVKGIGLSAAGATLLLAPLVLAMKWLIDNHSAIIDATSGVKGMGQDMPGKNDPGNPLGISFQNPYGPNGFLATNDAYDKQQAAAKKVAAAVKSIADAASMTTTNTKTMGDALSMVGSTTPHVLTVSDAMRLLGQGVHFVIDGVHGLVIHLDKLATMSPKPKVDAASIIAGTQRATELKQRLNEFDRQDVAPKVNPASIIAGSKRADELKQRLDALNQPDAAPPVDVSHITNAQWQARVLRGDLQNLNGSSKWVSNVVTNHSSVGGGGGMTPGFASGTADFPGGVGLVGERGPELVTLPRGTTITPADKTAAMLGGGGSKQPVTINISIAGRNVGQVLLPDIVAGIRSAVGTVST